MPKLATGGWIVVVLIFVVTCSHSADQRVGYDSGIPCPQSSSSCGVHAENADRGSVEDGTGHLAIDWVGQQIQSQICTLPGGVAMLDSTNPWYTNKS